MKVVITEKIHEAGVRLLQEAGFEIVEPAALTDEAVTEAMKDAVGMLIRGYTITDAMMEQAPQMKILSMHGVGTDNLDLEAAKKRGIAVTTTPGANSRAVAEHAMALLLAAAKSIVSLDAGYRREGFGVRYTAAGCELCGKTLGIVGGGHIGRLTAQMAKNGFGMRVLIRNAHSRNVPEGCELAESLDELWEQSDFISLHCPSTPATRHLVNEEALRRMKKTAVLINCARGAVVDEAALIRALREKEIAGACLDVTEEEPLPADSELFTFPNVILTPHFAASAEESAIRMAEMAADNIIRYLRGGEPAGRVV